MAPTERIVTDKSDLKHGETDGESVWALQAFAESHPKKFIKEVLEKLARENSIAEASKP